jgi:hypothetical protein
MTSEEEGITGKIQRALNVRECLPKFGRELGAPRRFGLSLRGGRKGKPVSESYFAHQLGDEQ